MACLKLLLTCFRSCQLKPAINDPNNLFSQVIAEPICFHCEFHPSCSSLLTNYPVKYCLHMSIHYFLLWYEELPSFFGESLHFGTTQPCRCNTLAFALAIFASFLAFPSLRCHHKMQTIGTFHPQKTESSPFPRLLLFLRQDIFCLLFQKSLRIFIIRQRLFKQSSFQCSEWRLMGNNPTKLYRFIKLYNNFLIYLADAF